MFYVEDQAENGNYSFKETTKLYKKGSDTLERKEYTSTSVKQGNVHQSAYTVQQAHSQSPLRPDKLHLSDSSCTVGPDSIHQF